MSPLTIVVAMAAAISFGAATGFMHHGASNAPGEATHIGVLLAHVVRQWRWLVGMAASLTGFLLHALALHLGSLAVVQPIVVTALIFSFLVRAALDGKLPSRTMMVWATLTAAGLAVFLVAVGSTDASSTLYVGPAVAMLAVGAVVSGAAWWASLRDRQHAGVLLGIAAGVVFGLIAGVLKETTNTAHGGLTVLESWPVYVLALLGLAGFLLNQRAYHQAPLSQSLPATNTVNPLVAVIFGAVAFGERPSDRPAVLTAQVVGLTVVLVGVFLLARTEQVVTEA